LTIAKASPKITLDATGVNDANAIYLYNNGSARWGLQMTGVAESGGNVGSDWYLYRYSDTQVLIDAPLQIARSTGQMTLSAPLNLPGNPTANLQAATKQYVDARIPKFVTATRDMTAATGNQVITGVGFSPKAIIAINAVNGTSAYSIGMATALGAGGWGSTYKDAAGNVNTQGALIPYLETATGAHQSASIASFDADGFTLSWAKTGAPTGTANLFFLCFP
jgi:hypothetical protein